MRGARGEEKEDGVSLAPGFSAVLKLVTTSIHNKNNTGKLTDRHRV